MMRQPSPRAHRAVQPTSAELVRRWRTRPRRPAPPCGASVLFVKTTGAPVPDANRGAEVDAARPRSAPARTHGIKNAYGYSLPTQPGPAPAEADAAGGAAAPAEAPRRGAARGRRARARAAPDFSGDDAAAARFKLLQSQGVTQRNLNAFAARLEAAADALGEGDARAGARRAPAVEAAAAAQAALAAAPAPFDEAPPADGDLLAAAVAGLVRGVARAGPARRRQAGGAARALGVPGRATREGNADLYSETNLAKRELIRDDPEILEWLDKWWIATQEFDDKDKGGAMDFEEYAYFHGRLKKWIHKWAGDRGVTLPKSNRVEAREQLEEDFAADSGESGLVLHEDFVNSIFELADMWTESVAKYEYIEFLKRGYAHVYKQHLDLDALNFPLSWRRYLDEDSATRTAS
ncbi:hypothetical protein SO694_00070144 [Aureococcus anophagefferens]|uniref:EF-hand domain-containing protein n=1 Tax=Aureococcus anophagefferens TaxID=44056 RepID=A0ABR1FZH5_AURAN